MTGKVIVHIAVEGDLDEWVARKMIAHIRVEDDLSCRVFGKRGKTYLQERIHNYNQAAHKNTLWFVLIDLDRNDCAPALRNRWLPQPAATMCFRIAVRSIEAWLLADRSNIARFLGVSRDAIPPSPEQLPDPKQTLINLASRSRKRKIREGLVPTQGQRIDPAYNSYLLEFVRNSWNIMQAASNAPSLQRALDCLQRLLQ